MNISSTFIVICFLWLVSYNWECKSKASTYGTIDFKQVKIEAVNNKYERNYVGMCEFQNLL